MSEEPDGWTRTWCPECGPNVAVDEEGLCVSCGNTAVGPGVEMIAAAERAAVVDALQGAAELIGEKWPYLENVRSRIDGLADEVERGDG